MPKLTTEI